MNSHLCLNAETREYHTEYDESYTVISVPSQSPRVCNKGAVNKDNFGFQINQQCIVVIPIEVGIFLRTRVL